MTTKRKNRLRKMTFLNTHRLSDTNEDDKYTREKQFIEKHKDDYYNTLEKYVTEYNKESERSLHSGKLERKTDRKNGRRGQHNR